ncbi:S8 family serine peptidase [Paenibacillus sp. 453mf]|uniref:S8 family serine peptidase n=1 Tax=Paenibacillus sp. 453mf TaxID=1761874 RepID=UPI0008ED854A|nr:S8 family serine peptidase [Paenibacillus sp. 453mf]SFS57647.1 peptidase Vpr. Serine peptidase. MEROPS family S08A [Paenibacillus sp. 453mf]
MQSKPIRRRLMSLSVVSTLFLSTVFPAVVTGAEASTRKFDPSVFNVDQNKLNSLLDGVTWNSGKKQEALESAGQNASNGSKIQSYSQSENSKRASSVIVPQNYVPESDGTSTISVIVELSEEPIALYESKSSQSLSSANNNQRSLIQKQQQTFASAAKRLNATLKTPYSVVFNGYAVDIRADRVESLLAIPGVKAVYPDNEVKATPINSITPNMDESAPFIGSDTFWDIGYDGTGIKVGVLDTGIDYEHPSLADAYKGGYDFIDNDDDPYETPPNPNDPEAATDHGTHVSGTIAGRGNPLDPESGTGWVRGVAYGADLYAYRVLGPGGSGPTSGVIAAIEQSVEDDMDIINLSLGSEMNNEFDPASVALNNAALAGVVTVVANGNSGPDDYTLGSPGAAEIPISVGASTPPLNVPTVDGEGLITSYGSLMTFSPDLSSLDGESIEVVYAGLGTVDETEAVDLLGKVALIQRGSISFAEKSVNAQAAGAVAAIIYNNESGNFGGTLGAPGDYIPTLSISLEDGTALKSKIEATPGYEITFGIDLQQDLMADFSSRGPALPKYGIKPDISAPGVAIRSSIPAYGGDYSEAYADFQGTSMATPHVAGAAALLLDKDASLTLSEIKGLMTNNALKLSDLNGNRYEHNIQGAGRLDLESTLEAKSVALVQEETTAVESGDETPYETGLLSYGILDGGSTSTKTIEVSDIVGEASSYTVSTEWYGTAPGTLSVSESSITVPVNGQASIDVTIAMNNGIADGNYEGEIILTEAGGHQLQIPVYVYVGEPVEIPVVSDVAVDPQFFSPNEDMLSDYTDIYFSVNSENSYVSLDVYDLTTGEWVAVIDETEGGLEPGDYWIPQWDGTVNDYGPEDFKLQDGIYAVAPFAFSNGEWIELLDQAYPFVLDTEAPVSSLNDPEITVEGNIGTIRGRIESDLMVDALGNYSGIVVEAGYLLDGDWEYTVGSISDNGEFTIEVPIVEGQNEFEVYVYDYTGNGFIEPSHLVSYESDGEEPGEPTPGEISLTVDPSADEVDVNEAFNLDIDFSEVEDLYSAQFSLTYDEDLIKGTTAPSVVLSTYQEEQNPGVTPYVYEETTALGNGLAKTDYVITLVGLESGYTGEGALASFNFAGASEGEYDFELSNVRALNSTSADIAVGDVTGASVTVTSDPSPGQYSITGSIDAEAFADSVDYSETWYQGADGVHKVVVEAVDGNGTVAGVGTVRADGTYTIEVPEGTYTVRVVVPGHITETAGVTVDGNETLNFGPLTAGDINNDGAVNLVDLQLTAKEFGKTRGTAWANAKASAADINRDSAVDLLDISYIIGNYEL